MPAKIDIKQESLPEGRPAAKGDRVVYSARFFRRRGDEVTQDFKSIETYGDRVPTREIDGARLIEHTTTLGNRQAIAGMEIALTGMTPGGFREVIIPPHLAYGEKGTATVPANALIRAQIWLHEIVAEER